MNIQQEKRRCLPMSALAYFGGDSDASTSNRTDNNDMRVVGGDGSTNNSIRLSDASNVTLAITDAGQTARAIDSVSLIADSALQISSDMTRGALATVNTATQGFQRGITDLFDKSVNEVSDINSKSMSLVRDAYADSMSSVADAYETSKAGEQKVLVAGGLLVVALVAIFIVKK